MGVKATFTQKSIDDYLKSRLKLIDQAIIRRMQFLGEKLVNHARTNGSYTDRTGNLRNSCGYVVIKNGKVIDQNFDKSSSQSGPEGPAAAKKLATELASQFKDGYALVVVAGMNYAAAVESKGFDVLTSAELFAKTEFPRMVQELKLNIRKMK